MRNYDGTIPFIGLGSGVVVGSVRGSSDSLRSFASSVPGVGV